METKVCSRCGETKPLTDYRKHKRGIASYCRSCYNKQCSAYNLRNLEKTIATTLSWQKANPDRVKAATTRWRAKQPDGSEAAAQKKRRDADLEKARKQDRDWYAANAEIVKARKSAEKKAAYWADIEASRAARRARYASKRDYFKSLVHAHRVRKAGNDASSRYSDDDLMVILKAQKGKCAYCKKNIKGCFEVDHIIPISKGGSNKRSNIQLTCEHCNRSKSNQDPLDYAKRIGLLC